MQCGVRIFWRPGNDNVPRRGRSLPLLDSTVNRSVEEEVEDVEGDLWSPAIIRVAFPRLKLVRISLQRCCFAG